MIRARSAALALSFSLSSLMLSSRSQSIVGRYMREVFCSREPTMAENPLRLIWFMSQ